MKWLRGWIILCFGATLFGLAWSSRARVRLEHVFHGEDREWTVDRYRRAARSIREQTGNQARILTDHFDMHYAWMQYELYPIPLYRSPGDPEDIRHATPEWCAERGITHVLLSDPKNPEDPERIRVERVEDYFRRKE